MHTPYGPCPAALEAVESLFLPPIAVLAAELRRKLGERYRVPTETIHLLASADSGLDKMLNAHSLPLVGFPPSAAATQIAERHSDSDIVEIARGVGRAGFIGPDAAGDLPGNGIAVLDSPSDPLGSILSAGDAVRLSRACQYLVIDERFAESSECSMLPLATEFDNVVVLRSFEFWAGLQNPPCAWAVASPQTADCLNLAHATLEPAAIMSAIATLDSRASVGATLQLIREERSVLYRLLRKLSFLEPVPSWAPFIAARAQIVPREAIVERLIARGVRVHSPREPGLEQYIRIGIGSRTAMDRLRSSLMDLAPDLVG